MALGGHLDFMYIPMMDSVSILLSDPGVPVDTKTVEKPFISFLSPEILI